MCLGAFPVEGEDCLGRTERPVAGHSHCNTEASLGVIRGSVPKVGSRSLEQCDNFVQVCHGTSMASALTFL